MTFKSETGMAAYVGLYLVVTAAVFYGIYYFMENDQGLYALPEGWQTNVKNSPKTLPTY